MCTKRAVAMRQRRAHLQQKPPPCTPPHAAAWLYPYQPDHLPHAFPLVLIHTQLVAHALGRGGPFPFHPQTWSLLLPILTSPHRHRS